MRAGRITRLLVGFALLAMPGEGRGETLGEQLPLPAIVSDNLRLSLDLSTRTTWSREREAFFYANAIGIDLHKVISSETRDLATLIVQAYMTRLDNYVEFPPFFDDGNDWELVYRIVNLNLSLRRDGRLNVRVGHFELPYGLEHVVNTNGTLRDYLHPRNLGIKADWGVSVNGEFPFAEYEVGLTRGSRNEWISQHDPWAASGRIGTPRGAAITLGASFFVGEPVSSNGTLSRWRTGLDAISSIGPFGVSVEASYGKDEGLSVFNSLLELNWVSWEERALVYLQTRGFVEDARSGWQDAVALASGVRFALNSHWSLSTELAQDLEAFQGRRADTVVAAQLRFRY